MKKHRNHCPTPIATGAPPDTLQRAAAETLGLAAAQNAQADLSSPATQAAQAIPTNRAATISTNQTAIPANQAAIAAGLAAANQRAANPRAATSPAPQPGGPTAALSPAQAAALAAAPAAPAPATPAPAASNAAASNAAPASLDAASPAAQALLQRLMSQAARLRQQEPGFDLGRALRNPRFARLVAAGLDAGEAYDALRQPQLLDEAYRLGLAQGARQAAADYNRSRPVENGAATAGVVTALDPASLSRQQRQEIRRMVRSGKTVTF